MKRTLLSLFLILLSVLPVLAQQTGTFSASIIAEESKETLPGAVIEIVSVGNPDNKQHVTSGYGGKFSVSLPYGIYDITASFLSYEDFERRINVNRPSVDAGTIALKEASQRIDDIVLQAQAMRTSQKGDTVVYNADAFKVAKDADVEGLLGKMPGITITDGTVEAQGETVQKVFVDGKEFFGDDVTATIKNLPAEVVKSVEVYNKLSDQAEFTGMDDGEGYKAINIVTNMRTGVFGKTYAGYGFNDKYMLGGNVNTFKGDHRLSLIGLFNNVNQQNFATEDILGALGQGSGGFSSRGGGQGRHGGYDMGNFMLSPQRGVSTVSSAGLNYTGQLSEKVSFQGSYFFNTSKNENYSTTEGERFVGDNTRLSHDITSSVSRNYNHRFNGKLDYRINENNSLMVRPSMSFQKYSSDSESDSDVDVNTPDNPLSNSKNQSTRENYGYNMSLGMLYRHKFSKPGRTVTTNIYGNLSKNDNDSYRLEEVTNYIPVSESLLNQHVVNNRNSYSLSGNATYTEPITPNSQLSLDYRMRYSYSDSDRKTFLRYDERWGPAYGYDPQYDELRSNIYNSGYLTQSIGPGYRFGNEKTTLIANLSYQTSSLKGDQSIPYESNTDFTFENVTYFSMLNVNFDKTNAIRLFLRSYTDNPSVTELQDVPDFSNIQRVSSGNSLLKPSYRHNLSATYNRASATKGRSFMFSVGGELRDDHIADSTAVPNAGESLDQVLINGQLYDLEPNAQYTKPVNMSGYWNARVNASFGTPVNFIKSNLNLRAGVFYSEEPNYVNGKKNVSSNIFYNGGATLGSNISDRLDFTVTYNAGYNESKNSGINRSDDTYWSQGLNTRFKWTMWGGFTLSGSAGYSYYDGISSDFSREYLICNLYLGKKLFRNQRGELVFGVNDMLDQNISFTRNVRNNYVYNVTNNVIGRYFGLQFIYNIRNIQGNNGSPFRGQPDTMGSGPRIHREGGGPGPGPRD